MEPAGATTNFATGPGDAAERWDRFRPRVPKSRRPIDAGWAQD